MRECLDATSLAPNKRVNYAFGMVMGVDDFRQEQEHFEWKHRLSNLLLHGYGTVCGLRVEARLIEGGTEVEIQVGKGYAVSPQGDWVWVDRALCARLGEWLRKQPAGVTPPIPGPRRIYVRLCYRECETDLVPIVGRACASEEEARAASRITEAPRVEFSRQRPRERAETQSRRFGELLTGVQIVPETISPDDRAQLLDAVRDLGEPGSPGPISPPVGAYRLSEGTVCDTLREALAVWVTEVCPSLADPDEECILLACVEFAVDGAGRLIPVSARVDNCDRPVLVPDRLQQELFCLIARGGGGMGAQTASGQVRFRNVVGAAVRDSPPISHHLPTDDVAIVLAADMTVAPGVEATATGDLALVSSVVAAPLLAAFYRPNATQFVIRLRDQRAAAQPGRDWLVRWWAIPKAHETGIIDA